jgi:hypothetical protein
MSLSSDTVAPGSPPPTLTQLDVILCLHLHSESPNTPRWYTEHSPTSLHVGRTSQKPHNLGSSGRAVYKCVFSSATTLFSSPPLPPSPSGVASHSAARGSRSLSKKPLWVLLLSIAQRSKYQRLGPSNLPLLHVVVASEQFFRVSLLFQKKSYALGTMIAVWGTWLHSLVREFCFTAIGTFFHWLFLALTGALRKRACFAVEFVAVVVDVNPTL